MLAPCQSYADPGFDLQLQSKILLLLIPLIILPILVLGWYADSLLMDDARSRTRHQSTTRLEQIELQTRTQPRTARANASLFSHAALIQQYIETPATSKDRPLLQQKIMDLLFNYQLAYPEYYEIRILDSDGIEQIRSVLGNTFREMGKNHSHYHEQCKAPRCLKTESLQPSNKLRSET